MKKHPVKVFISYAREDFEVAKKLYYDLKKHDIIPWLDSEELELGRNWKSMVTNAIQESDYFLALLSSNSLTKKGFVQKELKIALEILDTYPIEDIFILPVRINDCKPIDDRLKHLHRTDLFPTYEDGLKSIIRAILPKRMIEIKQEHEKNTGMQLELTMRDSMDEKTIAKIWTIVGLSLLYITINAWALTQGATFNLPLNLFGKFGKYATSIFGIFVCGPMLWYLIFLQTVYLRYPKNNFWGIFPVAFNLELNFSYIEAKLYQGFFCFCFQVIPVFAQLHFIRKFFNGEACIWKEPSKKIDLMDISLIFKSFKSPGYAYDKVSFYPFLEPVLLIIFVLISICFFIYYLSRVYKYKQQLENSSQG